MANIFRRALGRPQMRPAVVNLALFLITLALTLGIPDDRAYLNFPDSADYLRQAGISIASKEFFAPRPSAGFYPRPFVVPLCYKLMGSEPRLIILMQKIAHSVAVFLLATSLLTLLDRDVAKYILLAGV